MFYFYVSLPECVYTYIYIYAVGILLLSQTPQTPKPFVWPKQVTGPFIGATGRQKFTAMKPVAWGFGGRFSECRFLELSMGGTR